MVAADAEAWGGLLDTVVWLDASDDVLLERINARAKDHRLKGDATREAYAVLERSRADYEAVLARMTAAGTGPTVVRFDTTARSPQEIAEDVLAMIPPP